MAICEQGYLCEVCGGDVEDLTESDLYLRYVLGEVDPERLHLLPERHIRCNPVLAQFIVAPGFPRSPWKAPFAKSELDPEFVDQEETRVTRGYRRSWKSFELGLPIVEYPLPEQRVRVGEHPKFRRADEGRRKGMTEGGHARVDWISQLRRGRRRRYASGERAEGNRGSRARPASCVFSSSMMIRTGPGLFSSSGPRPSGSRPRKIASPSWQTPGTRCTWITTWAERSSSTRTDQTAGWRWSAGSATSRRPGSRTRFSSSTPTTRKPAKRW